MSKASPVREYSPPSSRKAPSLDPRLLAALDATFREHAGPDSQIDVGDLQRSLKIRSEFLAQRILTVLLDGDGNGQVSREEFQKAVRTLVFGSTRERLRLAFRLHDLDGNGRIELDEIKRMIALNLAEEAGPESGGAESKRLRETRVDELARLFVLTADQDGDGSLTYDEFERIASSDARLLGLLAESEASRLAPDQELLAKKPRSVPLFERISRRIENRLPWFGFIAVWALANAALFAWGVQSHRTEGSLIMLARGAGATLDLNGALILFTVMRGVLTKVRGMPFGKLLPIDDAVALHRLLGHSLMLAALVHTLAHGLNYVNTLGIGQALATRFAAQTGLGLLVVSIVMWVFALPVIRQKGRFELFYFAHFGYLAWFALALVHAPRFRTWLLLPVGLFAIEWLLRYRRRAHATPVLELAGMPSGVTRVTLERPPGFSHRAGDYAFLKIPGLARHEWHPFTISSAPEREQLTFHVRSQGDWTRALRRLSDGRQASGDDEPVFAHVDGPYGAPSAHVLHAQHAVMIGAGIGVTPFASVLESLVTRANSGELELEKLYFYWLSRESRSFEWFAELLLELEQKDEKKLVDIHVCMTGGRGNVAALALNLARDLSYDVGRPDLVTGLRTQSRLGAPDFASELREIAARHAPHPVEVFYCGPPSLARKLRRICDGLGLRFRKEAF